MADPQRVHGGERRAADAGAATPGLTVSVLLEEIARTLKSRGVDEPFSEAREIVSAIYDVPRFWPLMNGGLAVEATIHDRALRATDRRSRGAPLAYAVGRASFRHLTLEVDERVLIPRPETEQLVDLVLDEMAEEGDDWGIAVDVGTGSGAIALSLAAEGRFARVYGTDVSLDALAVAGDNARLAQRSLRAPVELVHGSLLAPVAALTPRVIVSNPPYIALGEAAALPASVRDWEPPVALFGGADGLAPTARLVREAAGMLAPGGLLALEVDVRRASLVAELVAREPRFFAVSVRLDLMGRERFVLARRQEGRG
jgi:release factor glutamine methyltransferase